MGSTFRLTASRKCANDPAASCSVTIAIPIRQFTVPATACPQRNFACKRDALPEKMKKELSNSLEKA